MKDLNINPSTPISDMTIGQLLSFISIAIIIIATGYAIARLVIGLAKTFLRTMAGNDPRRLAYAVVPLFVMLIVMIAVIATVSPMLESIGCIRDSVTTKLTDMKGD